MAAIDEVVAERGHVKALLQPLRDAIEHGCATCHGGPNFTDSSTGVRHDIGTITPSSGRRAFGVLDGIDSPGLLGLWLTAPYLHDGSAASLEEAIAAHTGLSLSTRWSIRARPRSDHA